MRVTLRLGERTVLQDADLQLRAGGFLALIGPNGAGKSSLLRCMSGALRPQAGSVFLGTDDLHRQPRRWVAAHVGVVPQQSDASFACSVEEYVGMGRYGRQRLFGTSGRSDRAAVGRALETTGTTAFAHRPIDRLSGGEFRKVLLAQALAQEPDVLLLDEPLQQLDLRHQLELMDVLKDFLRSGERAIVAVFHDLCMAARHADELLLLHGGRVVAAGPPETVLTEAHLREVFGVQASIRRSADTGRLDILPLAAVGRPARQHITDAHTTSPSEDGP
ncbi:MAG TPA: ABC transporter ATP-binding protein [Planctomycetota bacterium]|nr:ABC transporter ATP-binding protein [Planctomycetota bacterium]